MPRTTHRVGALLLLVFLVLTSCSVGPSSRPPVAFNDSTQLTPPTPEPKPPGVPPLGKPARASLGWEDCTTETKAALGEPTELQFSCAKLLTTLDSPEDPSKGTSRVSVLGVGTGQIPLVVVNEAGGEPGTTFAARLALRLPEEMLNTFRIIGVDRRGTGQSDPAECVPQAQRELIAGFDPRATDQEKLNRLHDAVRESSQECLLDLDDRLLAYDTWRTAGDLEELRMELGVPKLHAIGIGESSRLLTTYAHRYPDSVGRMVLDGGPDPLLDVLGRHESQARNAESTFDTFAEDCVASGSCPLGANPRKAVSDLIDQTRATPLSVPGGQLTAGRLVRAVQLGLYDRDQWPRLTQRIAAAQNGNGAPLAKLVAPLLQRDASGPPRLDAQLITSCNDTTLRVPPQRSAQTTSDWVQRYPLFGGIYGQRLIWCGQWPVPQQPLPVPTNPQLPPIPVISTAHDPLMPELGSRHLADQLGNGVPLRWQGAGHGSIGRSECITSAVSRFLIAGVVPATETACPA